MNRSQLLFVFRHCQHTWNVSVFSLMNRSQLLRQDVEREFERRGFSILPDESFSASGDGAGIGGRDELFQYSP